MPVRHLWIAVLVVAVLLLAPLPLGSLSRNWFALTNTIENAGHPLVFWWLTSRLLPPVRSRVKGLWSAYLLTLVLAIAFGVGTEYLQSHVGRDASWEDVRNDAFGAMLALALHARMDLRKSGHESWQSLATVTGFVLASLAAFPLVWTVAAYTGRLWNFPEIWSADSVLARRFSYWKQGNHPGLVIEEPARDWRGYTALQVQVRSLLASGTEVRIRVHDQKHNRQFLDRYDKSFVLPDSTERTLSIPLEAIKHGPNSRDLDLSAVRGIIIFQEGSHPSPNFVVQRIWLVP